MKVNIRNDAPTSRVRSSDMPNFRTSKGSNVLIPAIDAVSFAGKGYLMGMLALTYNKIQTIPAVPAVFKSDDIPVVRIRNTD